MNKEDVLVYDIETYSTYDLENEHEKYIADAKAKWFGCYSYQSKAQGKYYCFKVLGNEHLIKQILSEHKVIVGFNSVEFDGAILKNKANNLWPEGYHIELDTQDILVRRRGKLMKYAFPSESLKNVAKVMNLPVEKGEIDFMIFAKDSWTTEEEEEIKKYLKRDVELTKLMFDKLYDYWVPFTKLLSKKNIDNWSWIQCLEGSLAYKWFCHITGCAEEYGEKGPKTEGGGRVIEPTVLEETDVIYVDVVSLYPHAYAMFNLLGEVSAFTLGSWHGNDVFKVQGWYSIKEQHIAAKEISRMLKERLVLKKEDPNNPMQYTYKILLNSFYGANRSQMFKNLYTPNSGADCCYLGRQIQIIMEKMMAERGYRTIAGDTDSIFLKHKDGKIPYEQIKKDLQEVTDFIKANVPFPLDTFNIEVEAIINYIMFVKDKKEKEKTLKKNYVYIKYKVGKTPEVVIMGLPIKKANATALGPMIFKKYIEPRMVTENKGKFEKDWIVSLVKKELKENLELTAQEYNCNRFEMYSQAGKKSLSAQISKAYLNNSNGKIKLIKNTRIGKVGSNYRYCTLEEAKQANLGISELDLEKVYNELSPFCLEELSAKTINKPKAFFNNHSGESTNTQIFDFVEKPKQNGGFFL